MSPETPTLHMVCGKVAAGKSTLCAQLAARGAIVIAQDYWMSRLYKEELQSVADYVRLIPRLRDAMGPLVADLLRAGLLRAGLSVVMDWPANTRESRAWMRSIFEAAGAEHSLHHLDVPEEICLARLSVRNASGKHEYAVSSAEFAQLSSYFQPPAPDEGFDLVIHSDR